MDKTGVLQIVVKAISNPVGPDGLVHTLLVFGALPRLELSADRPGPPTLYRVLALRK